MNWKLALLILGAVIGIWAVTKALIGLVWSLLGALVPIVIVGAIAYGLYATVGRKALGSSRRRYLP